MYITQLKLQKVKRRWYYTATRWHSGDVLQNNITFFYFFAVLVVWYTYSRQLMYGRFWHLFTGLMGHVVNGVRFNSSTQQWLVMQFANLVNGLISWHLIITESPVVKGRRARSIKNINVSRPFRTLKLFDFTMFALQPYMDWASCGSSSA